ncbi:Imm19 family immunity protein [Lacinutrix sp. MEBiC02595]
MTKRIKSEEIKNNSFFWYFYISLFRGYDEANEINIDEALEIFGLNQDELLEWENIFFHCENSNQNVKYLGGKLTKNISFKIEFENDEIVFYLNGIYIGNLSGHFQAWFLTLEELLLFENFELLFLLLLPMTGIEKSEINIAKYHISKHLKSISLFEKNTEYVAECILNGLIMDGVFSINNEIGIVNNQNNSVRNIEKYPRYKNDITELNLVLRKFSE